MLVGIDFIANLTLYDNLAFETKGAHSLASQ